MPTNKLLNLMRMQSEATLGSFSHTRVGTISAYDPANYAAKVMIQPNQTETGWLPIFSPWIGNQWGMFAPPSIGDMVKVHYQEGNFEAGIVALRGYNDVDRPLSVPSGEFWLVHKTGSLLKLHNDGSVEMVTHGALNATVGTNLTATVHGTTALTSTGDITMTAPNLNVHGNIIATGDITDGTRSMRADRGIYDIHTHPNVQSGPDNTGVPNQQE